MSNQIVISSGAKVRSLEGVLTGTAGIVNSVPLGGANGVATLDSNGKVPLSQLPASVVTYLGTWNAATNTPTLTNGVGDAGDLYICNVAGTVNFGAGPITFAVGDWVIYNGSEWQKSSGASGTVTSVAVTSTGNDAISITGSPITTAGSINIGFTGTSAQYVNGAGDLTTFPTLTGFVPYTGATTDVDLGVHVLNAQALHVKGTAGAGHLGLKHQSAAATGSANESLIYANVDGDLAWQNDNLYLTTLSTHANTANRVYMFPDASGTIALTSNLSSYVPYTGATSNVDLGSHNLTTTGDLFAGSVTGGGIFAETNVGGEGYIYLKGNGTFGILSIYNSIFANGYKYGFDVQGGTTGAAKRAYLDFGSLTNSTTRTYSFPDATGTLALTSDIPSLANYVTTNTNQTISGIKTFSNEQLFGNGITLTGGYITYTSGSYNLTLNTNILTANRNVYIKDGSGTLAFTSDIPSLSGYVQGSGTTNYHAKFTAGSTIGNSMLTDDGTTLQSIGATRSNLYLKAASSSYYSQLAFTNGSNGSFGGISYNNSGQYMQFETNSSEYMRLLSNGNLLINTTTDKSGSITGSGNGVTIAGATCPTLTVWDTTDASYNGFFGQFDTDLFIGTNANGPARFFTNGTERMRITSSGNVGIGTSSPSTKLEVSDANGIPIRFGDISAAITGQTAGYIGMSTSAFSGNNGDLVLYPRTSATSKILLMGGNVGIGTSSPSSIFEVAQTNSIITQRGNTGYSVFRSYAGDGSSSDVVEFQIRNRVDGSNMVSIGNFTSHDLTFRTANTERMRITSGGNVLINDTSGTAKLLVTAGSTTEGTAHLQLGGSGYSAFHWLNGTAYYIGQNSQSRDLRVYSGNNISLGVVLNPNATSWTGYSDERLKTNIENFGSVLENVLSLRTIKYHFKDVDSEDSQKRYGLIAQDLVGKFDEVLSKSKFSENDETEYYGVRYTEMIPVLVKAIQEQQAQIEELKALINK